MDKHLSYHDTLYYNHFIFSARFTLCVSLDCVGAAHCSPKVNDLRRVGGICRRGYCLIGGRSRMYPAYLRV